MMFLFRHLPPLAVMAARRTVLPLSSGRLARKVAVSVLLIEVVIFTVLGLLQNSLLQAQSEAIFLERVQAVSDLMGKGLLRFDSLDDPEYLRGLLGEELQAAMLIGVDGVVYNALDPEMTNKRLSDIPGIDASWLPEASNGTIIIPVTEQGRRFLSCVVPLYATVDKAPYLYAFFKTGTQHSEARLRDVFNRLALIAMAGGALTWVLILMIAHHLLIAPIKRIQQVMAALRLGNLTARVPPPISNDELGEVQQGLNAMATSLEANMAELTQEVTQRRKAEAQLQFANENLGIRVEERTRELTEANALLHQEILTRQQAQMELKEINDRLQGIMDNSPAAIFVVDEAGELVLHNLRFVSMYGVDMAPAASTPLLHLLPQEAATDALEQARRVRDTAAPSLYEETLFLSGRGKTLTVTAFPLRTEDGHIWAVCFIALDITEQRRLEAETLRARQLATIGELAASVAHEVNNPITGIINYAQLLLDTTELGHSPTTRKTLGKIISQSERIASIVRGLLAYSREEKEHIAPVDLRHVIEDSLSLTRYRFSAAGMSLQVEISPETPLVQGRGRELQQVLLNLLSNAYHALLEQRDASRSAPLICIVRTHRLEDGQVALDVEDSGPGIPEAILHKVTLPFFTTKEASAGTGLGLSICATILQDIQGALHLLPGPSGGLLARVQLLPWNRSSSAGAASAK